jgi:predicted TIM-barrel fold metal-dependent hydrolase
MVIDVEHHLESKASWEKSGGKPGQLLFKRTADGKIIKPLDDASWDVELHLHNMDIAGINKAIVSNPEIMTLEEIKACNDYFAELVNQYPKRFDAFASTAPLGGKSAFEEMERSVKHLGLKGIIITATVDGQSLDSRRLWPFYEKASELNVPIFVHPSPKAPGFEGLQAPYESYGTIGREFDLALATLRVCVGGVLEEFPDLKFIIAHFGGGFSSVKERVDRHIKVDGARFWEGKPLISAPYLENYNKHFNKLYFNLAGREIGIQTLQCALTNISPKRLLFATDYPPNFINDGEGMGNYVKSIRKLNLDKKMTEAILSDNAIRLFHIS